MDKVDIEKEIKKRIEMIEMKAAASIGDHGMTMTMIISQEMNKLAKAIINDKELLELRLHKDFTKGLFAIDFDPRELIDRFINSKNDACQLLAEDAEQLDKDWCEWIDGEKLFTKI